MKRTAEDQAILDEGPTVTGDDLTALNDLFPHYIFFRPEKDGNEFHTGCCGRRETISHLRRTELPWENGLLDACHHNQSYGHGSDQPGAAGSSLDEF